jgi:5-carboxymethyl-2-hydroxymuconate isomerase
MAARRGWRRVARAITASYLNLRMGRGRSDATKLRAGNLLLAGATSFFSSLLKHKYVGVTLQIDEGQEVFDGKLSTLHPLFKKPT